MTNKKNEDNLEEMYANAVEGKEIHNDNGNKKLIIGSVVSVVVIVGIFAFAKIKIRPQDFTDLTAKSNINQIDDINEGFLDLKYPTKLPNWAKQPFQSQSFTEEDETHTQLMKFAKSQNALTALLGPLPSSFQGDWEFAPPAYTNDITKATIDGKPNKHYSYTLQEDYLIAYGTYLNRLINPVFGDWVYEQRDLPSRPMKAGNFNVLASMFHPNWWDSNIIEAKDYSKLPIFADWEGNNFEGANLAEPEPDTLGVWYGTVNTEEDIIVGHLGVDENNAHIISIDTPIIYYAFGENKKITKNANLKMTLASNPREYMPNRVVITDAQLIFK